MMREVLVDDGPAASVDVLISHALGLSGESEFDGSRGEDVEGSWSSVLDDDDRAEVLGDESAEAGEVLDDGAWVSKGVR